MTNLPGDGEAPPGRPAGRRGQDRRRDVYVIEDEDAEPARHSARVDNGDAALAELEGLVGDHDVQAAEARHLSDRLVCMLTRVYPAPERVLGPRLAVVMDAHPHGVALLNPPRT